MTHRLRSQNRRRQLLIQLQRLRQGWLIELLAVLGSIIMLALAARTLPMVIAQREWVWLGVIVLLGLATGLGGGLQARALLRKSQLGNAEAQRLRHYRDFERFRTRRYRMLKMAYDRSDITPHLNYQLTARSGDAVAGEQNVVEFVLWFRTLNAYYRNGGVHTTTEHGASLMYRLDPSGQVRCLLFPATLKNPNHVSDKVLLATLAPARLLDTTTQQQHLRYLAAYMAHTSLNGLPTLRQRWTIGVLLLTKAYVKNGTLQPSRLRAACGRLWKWVLGVGLVAPLSLSPARGSPRAPRSLPRASLFPPPPSLPRSRYDHSSNPSLVEPCSARHRHAPAYRPSCSGHDRGTESACNSLASPQWVCSQGIWCSDPL